jgi:hypothetical protein
MHINVDTPLFNASLCQATLDEVLGRKRVVGVGCELPYRHRNLFRQGKILLSVDLGNVSSGMAK